MAQEIIDIANFRAGVQDAPAFVPVAGGASRMLNYLVDFDGELIPRPGHTVLSSGIITPKAQSFGYYGSGAEPLPHPNTGSLVVTDSSDGKRRFFRLAENAHSVISKDRLFISEPDDSEFRGGYWVDFSGTETIDQTVAPARAHKWSGTLRPGINEESGIQSEVKQLLENDPFLVSSHFTYAYERVIPPVIVIDVYLAKNEDNPFTIRIYDNRGRIVRTLANEQVGIPGNTYRYTWTGENDLLERVAAGQYYPDVSFGNTPGLYKPPDYGAISHPFFINLNDQVPNSDNPLEFRLKLRKADLVLQRKTLTVDIKVFETTLGLDFLNPDSLYWRRVINSNPTVEAYQVRPNDPTEFKFVWRGFKEEEDNYEAAKKAAYSTAYDEHLEDHPGALAQAVLEANTAAAAVDKDNYETTPGQDRQFISQAEFENAYLTVKIKSDPASDSDITRRYYLKGFRRSKTAQQIAGSLSAGFTVAQSVPSVVGAAAGAVVATAGIYGSVIDYIRRREDEFEIPGVRNQITPAKGTEKGFYPGGIAYCFTYSDNVERTVETLPSEVQTTVIYDFEGLANEARTLQSVDFKLPGETRVPYQYKFLNIYVARTTELFEGQKLPQEVGLDFMLIAQLGLGDDIADRTWIGNENIAVIDGENYYRWRNESAVEPFTFLNAYDNDPPPLQLTQVTSYGSRIWGVNKEDNSIRYSKLGPSGYHFFPAKNALIQQIVTFDDNDSPIVKIHPAANDSMLYVFKEDMIHIIRGHGEIRGLNNPQAPIDVDMDASVKIEGTGTSSPRSVCTLKRIVLFVGSDKILYSLSGTNVEPFSLSIQPYLEGDKNRKGLSDADLANIFAFQYRNCYHLCLPNETLVLDLQKQYWTVFNWALQDAYWMQRSTAEGNKLYAIDTEDTLLELYPPEKGSFVRPEVCEWESNTFKLPYRGLITGIYVYHDQQSTGNITVAIKVDDKPYISRSYRPSLANRFRQGFSLRGQRAQVLIRDENENKLRIDRIQLEVQV